MSKIEDGSDGWQFECDETKDPTFYCVASCPKTDELVGQIKALADVVMEVDQKGAHSQYCLSRLYLPCTCYMRKVRDAVEEYQHG